MDTIFDRFSPRWMTSNVVDMATAIYQEKSYDKLPILSDALQDAGCDSEEVLDHCRNFEKQIRPTLFEYASWVCNLVVALRSAESADRNRFTDAVCAWPLANMPRIEFMHAQIKNGDGFRSDFVKVQMELHKLDPRGKRFDGQRMYYWPEFEQLASTESRLLFTLSYRMEIPTTHREIWFPEIFWTSGVIYLRGWPAVISLPWASWLLFVERGCLERNPIERVTITNSIPITSVQRIGGYGWTIRLNGVQSAWNIASSDMNYCRDAEGRQQLIRQTVHNLLHFTWPGIEFKYQRGWLPETTPAFSNL